MNPCIFSAASCDFPPLDAPVNNRVGDLSFHGETCHGYGTKGAVIVWVVIVSAVIIFFIIVPLGGVGCDGVALDLDRSAVLARVFYLFS